QKLVNNAFQLDRNMWIEADWRDGRRMQDGIEDNGSSAAFEGMGAGEHLVKHSAKRKQVCPAVQFFSARLFGRHISDGSHGRAGRSEVLLSGAGSRTGD